MVNVPAPVPIEAFHLTFLAHLSKDPNKAVIKGGQNLRLFFESVRHSDDLDMDVSVTPTTPWQTSFEPQPATARKAAKVTARQRPCTAVNHMANCASTETRRERLMTAT